MYSCVRYLEACSNAHIIYKGYSEDIYYDVVGWRGVTIESIIVVDQSLSFVSHCHKSLVIVGTCRSDTAASRNELNLTTGGGNSGGREVSWWVYMIGHDGRGRREQW